LMEKGLLFCGACAGRMLGIGEALKSELSRPVKLSELWLCCSSSAQLFVLFGVLASAPCGGLAAMCTSAPCPPPGPSHAQAARRVGVCFAAPSLPPLTGDSCSSVTLASSSSSAAPTCAGRARGHAGTKSEEPGAGREGCSGRTRARGTAAQHLRAG